MLTSSGISSVAPAKLYRTGKEREPRVSTVADRGTYDSVTLSSAAGKENRFMDMVSRLTYEVRTANTTGDIHALRQQVAAGEYTPDPMSIAARILFLGEGA